PTVFRCDGAYMRDAMKCRGAGLTVLPATHTAVGKPSNGRPCGAKKSPAWKQGLVGGSRPGRGVPIDEQGIIPLSRFRCDGDHKFTLSAPLVEKLAHDDAGRRRK